MEKINYKSDFKINERSETIALEVPFVFSYYVFDNKKYVASFDGNTYVNCERKENGSLDVIFNSPGFGVGRLKVERKYAVDDTAFADGVFDVVTVDKTDVFITSGKTFETYVETLVVPPYLKGDKGDPMTWSTMTETEREELVHDVAEAIDPEMVMTENEKSRQEAEQGRQTAEQQRSTTFNTLKGEMQSAITAGNAAAGNAQKVVNEYDTKVSEQDSKLSELGSEVDDFKETITNQVNNYKPIEINGNVTNAADEEDITSDENNLLKLKDRNNLTGMGYVILRKNKSFSEQLTQTNTIYEIRYDFDLDGGSVTIPSDSTLKFEGGSIKNGKVLFDNTTLSGEPCILTNIILGSTIRNSIIYLDWFGGLANDVNADCANAFKNIGNINAGNMPEIKLKAGTYYSSSFRCPPFATISGAGRSQTIIKAKSSGLSYEYGDVQTNDLFIAVYQPRTKIMDLTIDGGELEDYDNVGIGSYQTGNLLTIERCIFINCSKGALLINPIGSGVFNISHNEFICSGDDYCININSSVDHVSIQDNDFERINKPNASIIKYSHNYSGMNIRVVGNRFENVLAKHYIELKAVSLASIIALNKYFGNNGEFDNNASVYKIDSTAYQLQIYNDNIWGVNIPHYLIAGEKAVVVFDKMNISPSNIYYGYYNENGNFVSLSTLPSGNPRVLIMTTEGITYYPSQSKGYKTMFPDYSQIGALFLYPEGATRVIDTNSDAVAIRIRCSNLYLNKNNMDYPLTDLFQQRNGTTTNRPTSPVQGSVYFDTTLNKPIWWAGDKWVDATGADA